MANVSHDQNFKNLILDYPRDALALFAAEEAPETGDDVRIEPLRQEQLKERLGDRFRELDVPLLVEWDDGRRETVLFVVEEETEPRRFSPHRLAHYCLDLAQMHETDRVVPVAIFLRGTAPAGEGPAPLVLGTERRPSRRCRSSPASPAGAAATPAPPARAAAPTPGAALPDPSAAHSPEPARRGGRPSTPTASADPGTGSDCRRLIERTSIPPRQQERRHRTPRRLHRHRRRTVRTKPLRQRLETRAAPCPNERSATTARH